MDFTNIILYFMLTLVLYVVFFTDTIDNFTTSITESFENVANETLGSLTTISDKLKNSLSMIEKFNAEQQSKNNREFIKPKKTEAFDANDGVPSPLTAAQKILLTAKNLAPQTMPPQTTELAPSYIQAQQQLALQPRQFQQQQQLQPLTFQPQQPLALQPQNQPTIIMPAITVQNNNIPMNNICHNGTQIQTIQLGANNDGTINPKFTRPSSHPI
jgi:hypothetical protein